DYVIRIGYISIAVAVVCVLIIAACLVFLPGIYGWPDAVAAAVAWVFPIALLASFVAPGFRLALKDRKAEPRLVQGQLVGASSVSTSVGLGMLMVQTRGGVELSPLSPSAIHAVVAIIVGAILAGAVYGVSFLLQRRWMEQVQALVPKT